jgi:predicted  nucleic acid-binding Zn-ribbon protein
MIDRIKEKLQWFVVKVCRSIEGLVRLPKTIWLLNEMRDDIRAQAHFGLKRSKALVELNKEVMEIKDRLDALFACMKDTQSLAEANEREMENNQVEIASVESRVSDIEWLGLEESDLYDLKRELIKKGIISE